MTQPEAMTRELTAAALKAAPPATIYALTLNEWLAVAGIVWIVLQASYLVWRWAREARTRRGPPA